MALFRVVHWIFIVHLVHYIFCQTVPIDSSSGPPSQGSTVESTPGVNNGLPGIPNFGSHINSFGIPSHFFQSQIPSNIQPAGDGSTQTTGLQTPFYNFPNFPQFPTKFDFPQPSEIASNNGQSTLTSFPQNNFFQHGHPSFIFGGSTPAGGPSPAPETNNEQSGPSERISEKFRSLGFSPFGQLGRSLDQNAGQEVGSIQHLNNLPVGSSQTFGASTQTAQGTQSSNLQSTDSLTQTPTVGFYGGPPNIGLHSTDGSFSQGGKTQTESSEARATLVGPEFGHFGFPGNFGDFGRHFPIAPPHLTQNFVQVDPQQPQPVLPIPSYKANGSQESSTAFTTKTT